MTTTFTANNAEAYQHHMGRWSERLATSFLDFASLDDPGSILDVGCGTGSLTFLLAERFRNAQLAGIDFSQSYVDFARARAGSRDISFEQGDASAMKYADQSFDSTLSLLVLNFIPGPEKAVREMARVTKGGGIVAASVWDFRGGAPYLRMLFDTAAMLDPEEGGATRARAFSMPLTNPGELTAMWQRIGLREIVESFLTIRMEFASFADYWEPFLGGQGVTGSYVKGLPAEKRSLLEHHVRLAYLSGSDDGPRSFATTACAVRGVR
ncbi:MAG: class I SAM-dependent methyltransferase [Bradyrhizobium sp.]|uniref:class I SAM-dependent methyltransferase n=1 Tax=Bradyrhizobium sp. TaxID=376 RepID=UPI0025BCD21E|nr:class I SAM-dependent methyltransferase [Bradyrhizobium sp.]MBI5261568.1 class I SAM-dependent methyltransferase [Bradyrhizobium sp.]